ncbi:hypothetical protein PIB30_030784 [Stylosanthes scabra]|uniref:Uncharacterized protein n=1 Tax=Stylosanthes scabra TaxID=79078 RepID=A0ABU6ZBD7_9FABA|nr:hypothetical protein [Stylosanthes scabra]
MRVSKRLHEIMHEIRTMRAPHEWIRDDLFDRLVEFWRQEDYKKLKQTNKRNKASVTGGSLHTGGSTTYEATRKKMTLELGRTPTQSEVFARTHTQKEDRLWVDKRSDDVNFGDPDDDDTASGPPDLREQVTLLNMEISQQAVTHAQRVATAEAVYAVKTQPQEVSELKNAYSDMYNFQTCHPAATASISIPETKEKKQLIAVVVVKNQAPPCHHGRHTASQLLLLDGDFCRVFCSRLLPLPLRRRALLLLRCHSVVLVPVPSPLAAAPPLLLPIPTARSSGGSERSSVRSGKSSGGSGRMGSEGEQLLWWKGVVVAASSFLNCRWCLYHCCSLPQLCLYFKFFE